MKNIYNLLIVLLCAQMSTAQSFISGSLTDGEEPIMFANIALYDTTDVMIKVETSDIDGKFTFTNISDGVYYIVSSFIGYQDYRSEDVVLAGSPVALGSIAMSTNSVELETAVVKAKRALVEVKPDRTVFNVEGTINSVGDNGLGLLRKAPGVMVDNNNNISVLSRSGVLIYVDGKRLPLAGDDLVGYLQNLPAEQIDRMDIITNPGAKYEAEGNAGIIDIRLKRDKSHGTNGSISGSASQGRFGKGNLNASGNYRNSKLNSFGTLGYFGGTSWNEMFFTNKQNGLQLIESNNLENGNEGVSYRWGTDFFIGKDQTIGFLVSGQNANGNSISDNRVKISTLANPNAIDSTLIAANNSISTRDQSTYNLNYALNKKTNSLNIDLDYGRYRNTQQYDQPNRYYEEDEITLRSEVLTSYDTPVDIDIYTAKLDYETDLAGGKFGTGAKFSRVSTDNTFLFYNGIGNDRLRDDRRSNEFFYDEDVYALYGSYARPLSQKVNFSGGLRMEITDAQGDLDAFVADLEEDPIDLEYTNFFPTVGFTYQHAHDKAWSLNYGRRINRPDYNVLNPFRVQMSEVSFMKGNEKLSPEIVNNLELGFTYAYRFNFKLSFSRTTDQITRLIAPDDEDPRAGFITWANLATQDNIGFNAALPFQVTEWWNAFVNIGAGYIDNQADYGDGAVVDVQAFTYTLFQQQTFTLPKGFVGEISGYYAGPGVWGGVFKYDPTFSLDLGLQKKFFNDNMNIKLSVNDIFFASGWQGVSNFDGLEGIGNGNWDSRRVSLSVSYLFGNKNVNSRKRKTGIEAESKRVGS